VARGGLAHLGQADGDGGAGGEARDDGVAQEGGEEAELQRANNEPEQAHKEGDLQSCLPQ
jgi:hypothetical protein